MDEEELKNDLMYLDKKNKLNFYFIIIEAIAIGLLAILMLIT